MRIQLIIATLVASALESYTATLGIYSETADSLGFSGGKATSARYTDEANIGEIVGSAAVATMDDDRGQTKRSIKRHWWQR